MALKCWAHHQPSVAAPARKQTSMKDETTAFFLSLLYPSWHHVFFFFFLSWWRRLFLALRSVEYELTFACYGRKSMRQSLLCVHVHVNFKFHHKNEQLSPSTSLLSHSWCLIFIFHLQCRCCLCKWLLMGFSADHYYQHQLLLLWVLNQTLYAFLIINVTYSRNNVQHITSPCLSWRSVDNFVYKCFDFNSDKPQHLECLESIWFFL